jgi:Heterokaryon incompatibility protein (HET)
LENLADMKKRIPLAAMPKTHRDAVLIARGFNVRYLYIDALCIIQNSHSDWESHSAKMWVIYRNSLFTIAASHAKDVSGGCFIERDGLLNQPFCLTRYESPTEMSAWLVRLHHPINQAIPSQSSLESRAWVYQEQMLSRRVLSYEANGLRWHCTRGKHSEQYPGLSTGRDAMSLFQEKILALDRLEQYSLLKARNDKAVAGTAQAAGTRSHSEGSSSINNLSADLASDEKEIEPLDLEQREAVMKSRNEKFSKDKYDAQRSTRSFWHEMVEEYTSKNLSHENDRLAAIFGIADAIASKTGATYHAGLWKNTLVVDLLWSVPPQQALLPESSQVVQKRLQVAPSWSWACVTGPVQYPSGNHLTMKNVHIEYVSVTGSASQNTGKIIFRGIVRTAYITKRVDSNSLGLAFAPWWNPRERILLLKSTWRPDEPAAEGSKITLLEIARDYDPDAKRLPMPRCSSIYAIAVATVDKGNPPVYRRVGLASWPSQESPVQHDAPSPPKRPASRRSRLRDRLKLPSRSKSVENPKKEESSGSIELFDSADSPQNTVPFCLKKDTSGERWLKNQEHDGLIISHANGESAWPAEVAVVVVV